MSTSVTSLLSVPSVPSLPCPPSPPPTPPHRRTFPYQRRFEPLHSPCEWIERYRPGGYHPVHPDDVFSGGRYKVLRKLGEGSYSTVWLARDMRMERYVALKIMVSDPEYATDETAMLRHLSQVAPEQAAHHFTQLLDTFEHLGPNGLHKCFVFEPMGPNGNTMLLELPQFKDRRPRGMRYPLEMAKSILKQSLQALALLHEHGIAHGDFQPGNILFVLDNIDSKSETLFRQPMTEIDPQSISPPVKRKDGKRDLWAPRYLCIGQPLADFTNYTDNIKIKLSDLGGAYFFTDPPTKPVTPAGLRAPEFVLTGTINNTFDVWSFGCLLFELVTGTPLFCTSGYGSKVDQDDEYLFWLTIRLGPLPDELYKHWKRSSFYFTPQRELFNCLLGGVKEGEEPLMLKSLPSLEEDFDAKTHPDMDKDEASQIKSLIRRILQYDPAKRPSAAELLQDPWFREP
ncbi:serine protein kinase [Xylaria sp. FL0933]|nr:serine protein kinase [Xylaria sp. FL0933]